MSLTLDYASTGPVPEEAAQEIVSASRDLLERDWWAEPLIIRQSPTKRLVGSTKIILGGYGMVEVPDDEEAVMLCRDAGFIVKMLTEWSQEYKVSWFLAMGGSPIGDIVGGKQSPGVSSFAHRICADLKIPLSSAPAVLKKHESRKD